MSADGHELRFAVNYLSRASCSRRLLVPLLRATAPRAHRQRRLGRAAPARFHRHHADARLQRHRAYCQSKLAQIMFHGRPRRRLHATAPGHRQRPAPGDLHGDEDGPRDGNKRGEHARGGHPRPPCASSPTPSSTTCRAATSTAIARPAPIRRPTTPTPAGGCGTGNGATLPKRPSSRITGSSSAPRSVSSYTRRRGRRVERALAHQARGLQLPQALGEHVGADLREPGAQVGEALGPEQQLAHDQQRPALAHEVERPRHAAAISVGPGHTDSLAE